MSESRKRWERLDLMRRRDIEEYGCPVDHQVRIEMGMMFCYYCDEPLQSFEAANALRRQRGLHLLYPSSRGGA